MRKLPAESLIPLVLFGVMAMFADGLQAILKNNSEFPWSLGMAFGLVQFVTLVFVGYNFAKILASDFSRWKRYSLAFLAFAIPCIVLFFAIDYVGTHWFKEVLSWSSLPGILGAIVGSSIFDTVKKQTKT
jgi:hypothetical protein